ncbi:MAG TPA: ubiquinone/menaquinone biosynthesis methyltransferase [Candidatus Desulfofervidus auxilii]|nr:ubiquinone/menaquinone biosynthesis methyltransferase [Candidatus Desulfofervidus auxilii]
MRVRIYSAWSLFLEEKCYHFQDHFYRFVVSKIEMTINYSNTDKTFVQQKFSSITRFYDFLNSLLSLGIDHYWRWQTVKYLNDVNGLVLDLCAGTLPLSKALVRYTKFKGKIVALDFCQSMLLYGKKRWQDNALFFVCGDALSLPLKDKKIDAIMVAFGVRNFSDRLAGLKEMFRALKTGGKVIILEFSHPYLSFFKKLYFAYLKYLLPRIGSVISRDKQAYKYLAHSIQVFYQPQEWMNLMQKAGFKHIKHKYLTGGIVSIYEGFKD